MRSHAAGSFERLSDPVSLWRAWKAYARGKRRRPAVAAFDLDADLHVLDLSRDLRAGTWRPGPCRLWVVTDPKPRLVAAPTVLDRVVHQAVIAEIGPTFERSFIDHSYACRTGRGPQRAILRYLGWNRKYRYRLRLDVRRYFPSVHHDTLLALLFHRVRDPRTRDLLERLVRAGGRVYSDPLAARVLGLDVHPLPAGTGLAIGSHLSQWCGALYLDGLDHHVKRVLKVPGYLRFMDDMAFFSDDRQQLADVRAAVRAWLAERRGLELNPKQGDICPTTEPSIFLGYRVSRSGLAIGPKVKQRMRRKLRAAGTRGPLAVGRVVSSYRAVVMFGG